MEMPLGNVGGQYHRNDQEMTYQDTDWYGLGEHDHAEALSDLEARIEEQLRLHTEMEELACISGIDWKGGTSHKRN
jgi:hypothetical protein